jgi:hypothetical protein
MVQCQFHGDRVWEQIFGSVLLNLRCNRRLILAIASKSACRANDPYRTLGNLGYRPGLTLHRSWRGPRFDAEEMEAAVKYTLLLVVTLLTAPGGNSAFAYYCEGGQQPVPPAIAERMSLPLCGAAATQPWGPNGCQLCDTRNIYPNPFAAPATPRGHVYREPR